MTPERATLVWSVRRYLEGLLDLFITEREVQKLMYLAREAGAPLRFEFVKTDHGPHAEGVRRLLRTSKGRLVEGYDGTLDAPLALTPSAVWKMQEFLAQHSRVKGYLDRAATLLEGFESPDGLELLAAVHWVMTREGAKQLSDVAAHVGVWRLPHRRRFTRQRFNAAVERLVTQGLVRAG